MECGGIGALFMVVQGGENFIKKFVSYGKGEKKNRRFPNVMGSLNVKKGGLAPVQIWDLSALKPIENPKSGTKHLDEGRGKRTSNPGRGGGSSDGSL